MGKISIINLSRSVLCSSDCAIPVRVGYGYKIVRRSVIAIIILVDQPCRQY